MKTPKLKRTRTAETKKIDLAIKYRDQGKASGGGTVNPKRVRKGLEARNLPLTQAKPKPSGKSRSGRRRST
jgi:hypothetical protein